MGCLHWIGGGGRCQRKLIAGHNIQSETWEIKMSKEEKGARRDRPPLHRELHIQGPRIERSHG